MFLPGMLLFLSALPAVCQTMPFQRTHAINNNESNQNLKQFNSPSDTLNIIAVMVEFQPDQNRLTTGNGTFEPDNFSWLNKETVTIDPLPHDQSYFEAHLEFSKNYFRKVSGNKVPIRYQVLPDTYRVPESMSAYSPTGQNFTNEKLARFVEDVWTIVEKKGGIPPENLDFSKTAFAIFHAGAGRDIELIGTTLDKTPQDIPSLYLGRESLAGLLDRPGFRGFPVNDSSFYIDNSMILPRTLSRRGEDFSGEEYVLQLSINGLLCASIGSYLGLPDLFNTNTGSSGIGRFGLMDGESIFSYHGLFPPEPSAWEKIYLGWQSSFTVTENRTDPVTLPASSYHQPNSIARYNLSGSEHFLIENRHRDIDNSGVTLTFQQPSGTVIQQQFSNYDEEFTNQSEGFTRLLPAGVLVDVSNFDWSLPGGLDKGKDGTPNTPDDRMLNGGILIWHIDEAVINRELDTQSINANPNRRGIDLEEADGAQDIGRTASSTFAEEARGTAFDFWWAGNNASVVTLSDDTLQFYQNRFGPDTRPSNESNSGAMSYFELYDFSDNRPVASFKIRAVSDVVTPLTGLPEQLTSEKAYTKDPFWDRYPLSLKIYESVTDTFLVIPTAETIFAVNLTDASEAVFDFQQPKPQLPYAGTNLVLGGISSEDNLTLTAWDRENNQWIQQWTATGDRNQGFLSSPDDKVLTPDFTNNTIDFDTGTDLSPSEEAVQRSVTLSGYQTVLGDQELRLNPIGESYSISYTAEDRVYTGGVQLTPDTPGFYLLTDHTLSFFYPDRFLNPVPIIRNTPLEWPAFVDFDENSRLDVLYVNKENNSLEARNLNGAMLPFFPIKPPKGGKFTGTPLVAKFGEQKENKVLVLSQDSLSMNLIAFDQAGRQVNGFPIYIGDALPDGTKPIHPVIYDGNIFAVNAGGEIRGWKLNGFTNAPWSSKYGNHSFNKITGSLDPGNTIPVVPREILVNGETYNWPNPAHDFTNIRFQTTGPGTVQVRIITPSGRLIHDQKYETNGVAAEEYRISTDNWSSGIYLAMISAVVDGNKAQKIVKIAVIH